MKKLTAVILSLTLLCTTGCATLSAWWQNFTKDPIAQLLTFEQEVQSVLTVCEGIWQIILPFIPAAILPQAQQQYANAVASVGHFESALQDGLDAAITAKSSSPDLSKEMTDVTNAVDQLLAILDTYKGNAAVTVPTMASASPASAYLAAAHARTLKLHQFHMVTQ